MSSCQVGFERFVLARYISAPNFSLFSKVCKETSSHHGLWFIVKYDYKVRGNSSLLPKLILFEEWADSKFSS